VRPVVVQRTIRGGARSAQSTSTFTPLETLFGSWRARGLDSRVAARSSCSPRRLPSQSAQVLRVAEI